jgi:major histocompatibility complex class I
MHVREEIHPHPIELLSLKYAVSPGVVAYAFNPSTWEAEAGKFLSSRPAWSTE